MIELNGAVDFTDVYGEHVFARVADLLVSRTRALLRPAPGIGLALSTAAAAAEPIGSAALETPYERPAAPATITRRQERASS